MLAAGVLTAARCAAADPPVAPAPPPAGIEADFQPRAPRGVFEAQVALTRDAICPGSIDGVSGNQTRLAIVAFQQKHDLAATGRLDAATLETLRLHEPPLKTYLVTADDIARLRPFPKGWVERSRLDRLDYASVLELVAEKHWANPKLIRQLNPGVDWEHLTADTSVVVPNVRRSAPTTRPETIVISLSTKTLELLDADTRLLAHFPCSIARRVEKRPVGALEVAVVARNPNYTFDPAVFQESPEAQEIGHKLIIQPGPNNPVGVAWIGLNLPGYGIHGSPEPEQIGRTESHGCFRLANWNADYLFPLVRPGMQVLVEP